MPEQISQAQHESYVHIHQSRDFTLLRRRFRSFVFPTTLAFMAWYLLYVLMSSFAEGFMSTQLFGNVNVALVFGLLQFVSTFLIAAFYSRYANSQLDPVGDELRARYEAVSDR